MGSGDFDGYLSGVERKPDELRHFIARPAKLGVFPDAAGPMKVQIVVVFDTETRGLKLEGAGDPLLALTALDLAHGRVLAMLATPTTPEARRIQVLTDA